ncbi:MAG: Txe/YoeB family addiction module toxin [Endomicrobium sp.]|nr:Txe/YoeB family addiction module toxin [Endomicrobium sp.]
MKQFKIVYTKKAQKDIQKAKLYPVIFDNLKELVKLLENNPFQRPPMYEKLLGDFKGAYSRRLNVQHRLVYQVYKKEKIVKIIRIWTHYE